jgi:hypothetical protein
MLRLKESNFGYVWGWMRPHTIMVMEGDLSAFRQVEAIQFDKRIVQFHLGLDRCKGWLLWLKWASHLVTIPPSSEGVFDEKFKGWGLLICGSRPSIWFSKDVGWVPGVLNDPVDNGSRFLFLWLGGLAGLPLSG